MTTVCELCSTPLTEKQQAINNRFCSRKCSARWRHSQPNYVHPMKDAATRSKAAESIRQYYRTERGLAAAKGSSERMCSNNPMKQDETRTKVSGSLRRIGHKPASQGGNGRGLTAVQAEMLAELGPGWTAEFIQLTDRQARGIRCPNHYKIDLAHEGCKIAVEIDGGSHKALARQEQDARKTAFLERIGWRVFRVSNVSEADRLSTILKCRELTRTSQTE